MSTRMEVGAILRVQDVSSFLPVFGKNLRDFSGKISVSNNSIEK
jgi:hypothetical protein